MSIDHDASRDTQPSRHMPLTWNPVSGRPVVVLMVACGLVGLAAWMFYGYALRGQIGEDGMVFHTAARAWIDGQVVRIYDGAWITEQINTRFARWLTHPIVLHPWVYPPSFLLLMLPLGYLRFAAAFLVFQGGSFAAICVAACSRVSARGLMLVSLMLSPATAANVLLGQNAFLTGALLIGGAGLLRRSPLLAGVLLGLLSYKPQFCLMVPVALVAGRYWRTAIVAALTAAALALASAALFGPNLWQSWIELLTGGSGLFHDWSIEARLKGTSVYACAALLGASPAIANVAQGVAIILAAASVYYAFSRATHDEVRLATLLAAVFLAAPHSANYDAILLCVAAMLPLSVVSDESVGVGETCLLAAVWL
jgi:alpha-1,2-mannosyltransferase